MFVLKEEIHYACFMNVFLCIFLHVVKLNTDEMDI